MNGPLRYIMYLTGTLCTWHISMYSHTILKGGQWPIFGSQLTTAPPPSPIYQLQLTNKQRFFTKISFICTIIKSSWGSKRYEFLYIFSAKEMLHLIIDHISEMQMCKNYGQIGRVDIILHWIHTSTCTVHQ